jgi:hypothetical protein
VPDEPGRAGTVGWSGALGMFGIVGDPGVAGSLGLSPGEPGFAGSPVLGLSAFAGGFGSALIAPADRTNATAIAIAMDLLVVIIIPAHRASV